MFTEIANCFVQRRYMAAVLGLMVMSMMSALRINIGVAMVDMVNETISNTLKNDSEETAQCPQNLFNSTSSHSSTGEFLWSPKLQGYIQSAGYWGVIIFQIPGGILARKYGAKKVILYGLLVESFSNLLSPVAEKIQPYCLLVLTLLRGFAQAVLPPSLSVLSGKWFPRNERGFLGAVIYCGYPIGALLTGILCGKLCDLQVVEGWPLCFYTFGLVSAVFALLFSLLYYDTPEEDPWITADELNYIQKHLEMRTNKTDLPTPWFKMLTSPATNMLVLAVFGQLWMFFYFLSIHPLYFGTILHIPIKENGVLSGLPFIAAIIAGWLTCLFGYWMTNSRKVGVTALRKGINFLSCLVFAAGMIGISFAKCDIFLNEVFLYVAIVSNGIIPGGALISVPDVSPTYCGPLMGYASTVGSFSGVAATVMVGYLTDEMQELSQWRKIFFISAGVSMTTGLLYQFFGSAEIQPWDPAFKESPKQEQSQENESPQSTKL